MVIYEFRESVLNEALDKLDEANEGLKMSKKAMCVIEDLLCDMYDQAPDEEEPMESEEPSGDKYDAVVEGNDIDVNYRRRSGMRSGMRMRNMRGNMHGMRMRRSGRYSY